MKKILALLMCFCLIFGLTACGGDSDKDASGAQNTTMGKLPENPPLKPEFVAVGQNGSRTDDPVGFQLELPKVGDEIAVLETSMGNMYIRLFPESAPITVANFKGLVSAGYYNGITFHRVVKDFVIQGGDPKGNGSGGESVWGGEFQDEFNANLLNIRGSLSMANAGLNTNGSQFFINQNSEPVSKLYFNNYSTIYNQLEAANGDDLRAQYENNKAQFPEYADAEAYVKAVIDRYIVTVKGMILSDLVSDEAWEIYRNCGGNINLDGAFKGGFGGHSVFGQVFKGISVLDAIAGVQVNPENDKPLTEVTINKAYLTTVTDEILAGADPVENKAPEGVVIP